jgi:hypothetical protein
LWDANTGREIMTLYSAPPQVQLLSANFSKDGMRAFFTNSIGQIIVAEAYPWQEDKYPLPDKPLAERVQAWKLSHSEEH